MSFLSYRYLIVRIYSVIRHVWELNNVSIVDPVIPSGKDYQDIMYPWISSSLERLWLDKIWVYYNEPLLCHYRFLPQGMRNAALPNFANDLYRRRGCRIWRSTKWQLQTLTTLISIGLSSTSPTVSYLPLVDSVMGTSLIFPLLSDINSSFSYASASLDRLRSMQKILIYLCIFSGVVWGLIVAFFFIVPFRAITIERKEVLRLFEGYSHILQYFRIC